MLLFRLVAIFTLTLSLVTNAQTNLLRGPYLQSLGHESVIIKWRTDVAQTTKVRYGTSPTNLTSALANSAAVLNHEILIAPLLPDTEYYYAIEDEQGTLYQLPNYHFKTAPSPGSTQPIRTWIIGDFGKGNQSQLDVMQGYLNYTGSQHTDVWLWMGDNAYADGTDQEYQNNVFIPYDSIFPYIPFFPTPGNHDYNSMSGYNLLLPNIYTSNNGAYYQITTLPSQGQLGGLASGTSSYYSFNYGNIHFISLNSEIQNTNSRNTAMEEWLTQDLAQNAQDWTIVYFHQAPYSKGSHNSDDLWEIHMRGMRKNILPICDAGGVDLVLSGHSHNYERSYLLKGHYEYSSSLQPNMILDESSGSPSEGKYYKKYYNGSNCSYEGIVYVVMGNSGSKTSPGDDKGLNHPVMYISDGENAVGSVVLDVHADTLTGTYIRSTGEVIDRFQIQRINGCQFSGIHEEELNKNIVAKVYSDYRTGSFKIRFDLTESNPVNIQLMDMSGRIVYRYDFGNLSSGVYYHTIEGETLGLVNGAYNFLLYSGKQTVHKKIFKLKE
jgi:acid phosphatase type 7